MAAASTDRPGPADGAAPREQRSDPPRASLARPVERRARIALILLLLLAALAQMRGYVALRQTPEGPEVGRYEARYEALRPLLPASGTVGYLSDFPPFPLNGVGETAFYHAQYSLAPVVVARTGAHELVVGNFLDPTTDPARFAADGLTLVLDCGNGVALFRRQPHR